MSVNCLVLIKQLHMVYMYAFHGICIKYNYMFDIYETFFPIIYQ